MWYLLEALFDDDTEDEGGEVEDTGEPDVPGVVARVEPAIRREDEALVERVERAFRGERKRIRSTDDLRELRAIRADYQRQLTDGRLNGIAAVRGEDLIELLDDRITDLRAKGLAGREA